MNSMQHLAGVSSYRNAALIMGAAHVVRDGRLIRALENKFGT